MAEVLLLGTLHGAHIRDQSLLGQQSGLACRFTFLCGQSWTAVEGDLTSQTQVDLPADGEWVVWSHPLDLHLTTRSLRGWPKFAVEVLRQDRFGRYQLVGYGITSIPMAAGTHQLDVPIWRPRGTWLDTLRSHFLGITPALKSLDLLRSAGDRYLLTTTSVACSVMAELTVIERGATIHGMTT
ncbi:B9 domain-containing protein [Blastocladiella britannica]|nr:B9 domain-containing protein [Blastocladiella britannica]